MGGVSAVFALVATYSSVQALPFGEGFSIMAILIVALVLMGLTAGRNTDLAKALEGANIMITTSVEIIAEQDLLIMNLKRQIKELMCE